MSGSWFTISGKLMHANFIIVYSIFISYRSVSRTEIEHALFYLLKIGIFQWGQDVCSSKKWNYQGLFMIVSAANIGSLFMISRLRKVISELLMFPMKLFMDIQIINHESFFINHIRYSVLSHLISDRIPFCPKFTRSLQPHVQT